MFEQKYGIKPDKLLFWLGIYLATIIVAYIKLYNDAPIGFWIILMIENVMSIAMGLDRLMEEAMEEVTKGPVLWIILGGTVTGSILLIALFFVNFKLGIILTLTETFTMLLNKLKSTKNT